MSAPGTTPTVGDLDPAAVDGRVLRRTRNREAVIDALVELINEGNLTPGAKQIAARAGVSHRSVFRYFDDMNDLAETAVRREFAAATELARIPDAGDRSLDERITRLVQTRLELYQAVHWSAVVARREAPNYPRIDEAMAAMASDLRRDLATYFAPELAPLAGPAESALLDAVLLLTSFDSWDLAHRVLHYDDDEIGRSWRNSLGVLLGDAGSR